MSECKYTMYTLETIPNKFSFDRELVNQFISYYEPGKLFQTKRIMATYLSNNLEDLVQKISKYDGTHFDVEIADLPIDTILLCWGPTQLLLASASRVQHTELHAFIPILSTKRVGFMVIFLYEFETEYGKGLACSNLKGHPFDHLVDHKIYLPRYEEEPQ